MSGIVVFAEQDCPTCEGAKNLLKECGLDFEEIDITGDSTYLAHMRASGSTVPRIWDYNTFIGGYTELCDYLLKRELVPL